MLYLFLSFYYILIYFFFFFFNDTATTEIYTFSLHDSLPICSRCGRRRPDGRRVQAPHRRGTAEDPALCHGAWFRSHSEADRKSTRLNSSHSQISYAVFSLKKKKKIQKQHEQ